jgi:anti-anti-sigma factor
MSLPLMARGSVIGALTVMTTADSGRRYGEADLALASEVARRAALTIDNARTFEAEQEARAAAERAQEQTDRLQRVTAALAAALTEEDVARAVVTEAMAALAATAGTVVVRDGDEGRVVVAAGYPEQVLRPGMRLPVDGPFPLASMLRTGERLWLERAEDWALRFPAPSSELRAAGIGLPLRAGGEVIGAIGFRFGEDEHVFSPGDRRLALAMAAQCALALERVRLYEAERHASFVLQRALLPSRLPARAAGRLDVRYVPAAGLRAGGDFYDAVDLPDGRLSLVVGDVVGHGVEAAAVMGQLRSAWRAAALEGASPGAIARRLSDFAERVEGASVATVACAVLSGQALTHASAGHPPPLLRRPDGRAEYLLDGRGPPLAVANAAYPEATVLLEPGSLLLLYTDGVIERDRDLDRGMTELVAVVEGAPDDPGDVLARLTAAIGPEPADDCALLLLRMPATSSPLRLTLPAKPSALRGARAAVRGWLRDAGVDGREADDVVLAASEAVSNSVEHAYGGRAPAGRAEVELEVAREDDGALVVAVRDRGRWREPGRPEPGRGRGLVLMRAVMDEVDVDARPGGTTVRMRRRPRAPDAARSPGAPAPDAAAPGDGGGAPVRLDGEIDEAAAPALAGQLRALAGEQDGFLRLDLTDVRHIGSAGVRLLSELARELREAGGGLEVIAPQGSAARRVLDLTRAPVPVVRGDGGARDALDGPEGPGMTTPGATEGGRP